jgi:hypothetical protein
MSCVTSSAVRPSSRRRLNLLVALLLELGVTHRERLIDQQPVGVDLDHHRERSRASMPDE